MIRSSSFFKVWCILIITGALSISGCLGPREWSYPPPPDKTYLNVQATDFIPARLAVLPLEDLRGTEVKEEYWRVAIPLVPHGMTSYDRPEAAVARSTSGETSGCLTRQYSEAQGFLSSITVPAIGSNLIPISRFFVTTQVFRLQAEGYHP